MSSDLNAGASSPAPEAATPPAISIHPLNGVLLRAERTRALDQIVLHIAHSRPAWQVYAHDVTRGATYSTTAQVSLSAARDFAAAILAQCDALEEGRHEQ